MKRQFFNKFIFCLQYAYFFHYRTQLSLTMEEIIFRFPHLAKNTFQKLDNESLAKSREVENFWQNFIDEKKYLWLRIVNIPTILQNGNTYMHLAAQFGQTDMFEMILSEEDNKNPKNRYNKTPFIVACSKGRMNIALMLLKKSDELQIDLNAKARRGNTAFHLACWEGHSEIAKMIIKNSSKLEIDLDSYNDDDYTSYVMFVKLAFLS